MYSLHLNNSSNKWKAFCRYGPYLLFHVRDVFEAVYINDMQGRGQHKWPHRALNDDTCTDFSMDGSYVPDSINFANILVHLLCARQPIRCYGIYYFLTSHSE